MTTAPKVPDSEARQEIDSRPEEAAEVIAAGPRSGNRAGALAFLALAVVIGAAAHFSMADNGGAYLQRLDTELLQHAELSLQAATTASANTNAKTNANANASANAPAENTAPAAHAAPVAVAPSWPLALYEKLRGDIALYAAAAAAAAYLWHLSARARARRDAFLLYDKLKNDLKNELKNEITKG